MAEKILIIDDDLDTLRLVGLMLQRQGYQIVAAANGQQGLIRAEEDSPDLIVLDVMMPEMDGYEVARRLRKKPSTATIPILMFTAKTQLDDKVAGFEVGADDYLTKPTHPTELQAHVKALLARSKKSPPVRTSPLERQARVIGVLSARSGLGASTIAVNLAASLSSNAKADTILVEICPGLGTLGRELGWPNPQELTKLLTSDPTLLSRQQVRDSLWTHPSGIRCLLSSERTRDVHLINAVAQIEAVIRRLRSLARYVVLDLGAGLPAATQKIIEVCHERILVVEGTPNSVAYTKAMLEDLDELGVDGKKTVVVLNNRLLSDTQLASNQVQDLLGHSVAVTLTPAPDLFFQASRLQKAAVSHKPDSLTGQQFAKLSALILEREKQA